MWNWSCIAAARQLDASRRVGCRWQSEDGVVIGSVARDDLGALSRWPQWVQVSSSGTVVLTVPPDAPDRPLAEMHEVLRDDGRIRAWRDEPYPLRDEQGGEHAVIERAAARFWGCLTLGAHCNGYVADGRGRPSHIWVARRADDKPTDPGRLDTLIGAGVPLGQSPRQAVIREAWEEAGLQGSAVAPLQRGGTMILERDVLEGRQHEWLCVYDLCMPPGLVPQNQDGEVAWHHLLTVEQALQHATNGDMTVDAALATLDFALRHALLPSEEVRAIEAQINNVRVSARHAARFD